LRKGLNNAGIKQLVYCLLFAALFALLEYHLFINYFVPLEQAPLFAHIYPYHVFFVLPIFLTTSFVISSTNNFAGLRTNPLRSIARAWQVMLALMVLEDIMYFVAAGTTIPSHSWTCLQMGCVEIGFGSVPKWYFVAAAIESSIFGASNLASIWQSLSFTFGSIASSLGRLI
jgi:hypothetical protein